MSDLKPSETVYQLKATVAGIDPPVWRRLVVPGKAGLAMLHRVFQVAFDWEDCHLHRFEIDRKFYGPIDDDVLDSIWADEPDIDEESVRLAEVARPRLKFVYRYDFGDDWKLDVEVEKAAPSEPGRQSFLCLDGARTAPPEDCGGVPGYYRLTESHSDPLYGFFDPDRFNADRINRQLRRLAADFPLERRRLARRGK